MILELLAAGSALLVALCLGTLSHELLHAGCLHAAGVPVEIHWGGRPGSDDRLGDVTGALASVEPTYIPADLPPWTLRVAALSPLVLGLPLVAIAVGAVPDPFAGGPVVVQSAVVGWLACALPSPQDFSQAWHAPQVVAEHGVAADAAGN